jgi:hypothetical protein
MRSSQFDDLGIRFDYPADWEVEVLDDDGERSSVSVQSPNGLAFAIISLDRTRRDPDELADEAFEAMKAEYPHLDAIQVLETIDGHRAIGHDIEFLSLDMTNACIIRSFRTPIRTVLIFTQWSDLEVEGDDLTDTMAAIRGSFEETDAQ